MIPENTLSDKAKNKLNKIKELEKTVDREILVYRTYKFKNFQTMHTFGRDIYNGKITLKEADEDQSSLLVEIMNLKSKIKPQNPRKSKGKKIFLITYMKFLMVEEEFLRLSKAEYFQ